MKRKLYYVYTCQYQYCIPNNCLNRNYTRSCISICFSCHFFSRLYFVVLYLLNLWHSLFFVKFGIFQFFHSIWIVLRSSSIANIWNFRGWNDFLLLLLDCLCFVSSPRNCYHPIIFSIYLARCSVFPCSCRFFMFTFSAYFFFGFNKNYYSASLAKYFWFSNMNRQTNLI